MKALGEAGELGRPGLGGGDGGGRAPLGAPREWQVFPDSAGVGYGTVGLPVLASICICMPVGNPTGVY